MKRATSEPELLDGPLEPETLRGNLRDLARINRWLGGADLTRRAVRDIAEALLPRTDLTLLDVGTGSADLPLDLLATWGARWPRLHVTAVDASAAILDAARRLRPQIATTAGLALELADGRQLPYSDGAFDVAHSSLVLHHLEPDDAVAFLRELARVARTAVVVNDLARGRSHWVGAHAIARCCTRNAYTRHDAPLSVRRAYTAAETRDLLHGAGLAPVRTYRGFLGHRHVVVARHVQAGS